MADLVIMNLKMPGMSIELLCSFVTVGAENKPTSIVLVCANTRGALTLSSRCNEDAVITRPFKATQLLRRQMHS
jgi:AmiR/NasT family two-component response regulator